LVPLWRGDGSLEPRTLFWDYAGSQAARQGPWKLVTGKATNPTGASTSANPNRPRARLFNLDTHPDESVDVASENPERVQTLMQALATWQQDVADGATAQPLKEE
jgi:arylsulfatase A-like enzyme